MKKLKNLFKSFTLVELIIVIAIVAILSVAAFLVVTKWIGKSRDARRLSDVGTIVRGIMLHKSENGYVPMPSGSISTGTINGPLGVEKFSYVGTFGSETVKEIDSVQKIPTDPMMKGQEYIYGVSNNKKEFQVAASLEGDEESTYVNKVMAGRSRARVDGNYSPRGVTFGGGRMTVMPSLIFEPEEGGGEQDMGGEETKFVVDEGNNLPYSVGGNEAKGDSQDQSLAMAVGNKDASFSGVNVLTDSKEEVLEGIRNMSGGESEMKELIEQAIKGAEEQGGGQAFSGVEGIEDLEDEIESALEGYNFEGPTVINVYIYNESDNDDDEEGDQEPQGDQPGDSCDDGDAETYNDEIQDDLSCSGYRHGEICDDGNSNTYNDEIQVDGTCAGYSEQFVVASNGVTVKCKGATIGSTYTFPSGPYSGRTFEVVDDTSIQGRSNNDYQNFCTSNVTSMSELFRLNKNFNGDIGSWDTSSVTNMKGMFQSADAFNRSLNYWDVSNVTTMQDMFGGTDIFNSNISSWDTSSVTNMREMFSSTKAFNSDIGNWDVSNVTHDWGMYGMFRGAEKFNKSLNNWDVGNVKNMSRMFEDSIYNQGLNNWDTSSVINMSNMFDNARFNRDIGGWNVSDVTTMEDMFKDNIYFNQNINSWDVSNVDTMRAMFDGATSFNQSLNDWDISKVRQFHNMFFGATNFNGDITGWSGFGSRSTSKPDFQWMFRDASSFNRNIGNWDVSEVEGMSDMFKNASSFNQDLSGWCVSGLGGYDRDDFAPGSGFYYQTGKHPKWGQACE